MGGWETKVGFWEGIWYCGITQSDDCVLCRRTTRLALGILILDLIQKER